MLRDSPRQGLHPRRHLRFERPRSTTPAISSPARDPARKTQVALHSSAHAHTLPFGASVSRTLQPSSVRIPLFSSLERVMNLGESRIEIRISRSAWFAHDLCFPHS